jgi:dienelactone hydrolase
MSDSFDSRMDRRTFLLRGASAGALAAVPLDIPPRTAENPPADIPVRTSPVDARLAGRQLDSQAFCLSEYDAIMPSLGFSAADAAEARRWQATARARLVELLGGFPERVPLQAEVVERVEMDGYTRETILFQTRRNLTAIGYLLLPANRTGAAPGIVCIPGHGRGADDIVGIAEDGSQRVERTGYAKDFALQAVERGYAAFALEPLAFGHRRDAAARANGPSAYSCRPAAGAAMLFGQTMIGWRVWDVMRTIDYLQSRPEVAADRIATMGISGGGTVSLFAGAVDERIRAAVVSCYFNTFRDSIVSLSHCLDNYVPGLLQHMEMYDVAGLVAPRGLFVESGTEDRIFPIEGARVAYARTEPIFRTLGAEDRLGREIFEGGHEFHGVGAFEFLGRVV